MDTLIDTVKQQAKIETHLVHDCVEEVVITKMTKDQEELEEIKKRCTNVIIHGLKEPTDTEPDTRKASDESTIIDLLHEIKCDEVSVTGAIRLGKKSDAPTASPRPVKLIVASEEKRDKILRMAKNLKGREDRGLQKIFIHQDLTPRQREKRTMLVKEMKRRQEAGEKNLIIIRDRIVERRTRRESE
jgi:hypothetical protein